MIEDDVFYDLGSGVGKFNLYVAAMNEIRKSVGLEIGERRNREANQARQIFINKMKKHPHVTNFFWTGANTTQLKTIHNFKK